MAEINRYTQMPQPLMVNPISFEEFSRIPIARAKAEGAGVAALERIKTDYNVDDADLGAITQLVDGIDKSKTSIVEDISNNGINSQTVGSVIKLKRERDNLYKTKIQQAEENKKLLYDWRQNIDKMTMQGVHPAWYGEHIKQREYKNWVDRGGTFQPTNEEGLPTMFQSNFGVKYIDMDEDIRKVYTEASRQGSQVTKSWGAGAPSVESVSAPGGETYDFWTSSGGGSKTVATNKENLDAAMNMLLNEYSNPNTERGKFVNYADVNIADIRSRLEMYKNEFLDTKNITQIESKTRQLMGKKDATLPSGGTTPYELTSFTESTYKPNPELNKVKAGTITNLVESWDKSATDIDPIRKKYTDEGVVSTSKGATLGVQRMINFVKNIFGKVASTKDKQNLINTFDATLQKLPQYTNGKITTAMIYNAQHGLPGYTDVVLDAVKEYQNDQANKMQQSKIVTSDYLYTEFGESIPKRDEKKTALDLLKGAKQIVREEDRTSLDKGEVDEIREKIWAGEADVQGTLPPLSPHLLDKYGKYIPGMTSANSVEVKGKGKYYIEIPAYLKKTPNYIRLEELNQKILETPPGVTKYGYYIPNGDGTFVEVGVKNDDSDWGNFQIVVPTKEGERYYDIKSNEKFMNILQGKDFFTTHTVPMLNQSKTK
jgi:hypothetical protein